MRCFSFFINTIFFGEKIMCRHVPKVPYSSYAPDMYMSAIRDFVTHPILFINVTLQKRSLIYVLIISLLYYMYY
jgi:hypothetical protein